MKSSVRYEANCDAAVTGRLWPLSDRRTGGRDKLLQDYTSVCSAISSASSTSIPRYLTVLSSLL